MDIGPHLRILELLGLLARKATATVMHWCADNDFLGWVLLLLFRHVIAWCAKKALQNLWRRLKLTQGWQMQVGPFLLGFYILRKS